MIYPQTLHDLCTWLRQNSSGGYRPAGEAATVITALAHKADVPLDTSVFSSILTIDHNESTD
jgi:hypothetical protein